MVQDPLNGVRGALIPATGDKAYVFSEENGETFMDVVPKGSVICQGLPPEPGINAKSTLSVAVSNAAIPSLNSRPEASATLYLDFDGETVTDVNWNGGLTVNALPPSFNSSDSIERIWKNVSEDFAPFNVNVTTGLAIYTAAQQGKRMRVIVTPTKTVAPNAGGVAYLNSFASKKFKGAFCTFIDRSGLRSVSLIFKFGYTSEFEAVTENAPATAGTRKKSTSASELINPPVNDMLPEASGVCGISRA